jgi:two-component system CheB/CheR fusion protein
MDHYQLKTLEGYAQQLEQIPGEAEALLAGMHIGVTRFFRDAEAFQAFAQLLLENPRGKTLRLWSAGCSTGEEAYSLAMLLQERSVTRVKIFASDIHGPSIVRARRGVYSATQAEELPPERLQRFFVYDSRTSTYRVKKVLREMLVFSEHDLTRDPPFSGLDGILCRNFLIYLLARWQSKLLDLFHYALKAHGLLLLGQSESVGELNHLFQVMDRKARIYQRKEAASRPAMERFRDFLPGSKFSQ